MSFPNFTAKLPFFGVKSSLISEILDIPFGLLELASRL